MKTKVKSIQFRLDLEGRGIVNFDSSDKGKLHSNLMWKDYQGSNPYANNNVKLAKLAVYRDNNGDIDYKVKISSGCVRKAIFGDTMDYVTPEVGYCNAILQTAVAHPTMLCRGYMFAAIKDTKGANLKRKSPLSISDAIQTNNAKIVCEVGSASGQRNDTSLFFTETVGEITYQAVGAISLKDLQFVSSDPRFDRIAIEDDWLTTDSLYKSVLKANYPNDELNVGYFIGKNTVNEHGRYAESGLLFSKQTVIEQVKQLLRNMLALNIVRAGAYAKTSGVEITLIRDVFGNNEVIKINSLADVEALDFDIEDFFTQCSEEEVSKNRAEIDAVLELCTEAKKEKAADDKIKAAEKRAASAARKAKKNEESLTLAI